MAEVIPLPPLLPGPREGRCPPGGLRSVCARIGSCPSAFITGGSSGIELAIARMLGAEGYPHPGRQEPRSARGRRDGLDEDHRRERLSRGRLRRASSTGASRRTRPGRARQLRARRDRGSASETPRPGLGPPRPGRPCREPPTSPQAALPRLRATKGYVIDLASIAGTLRRRDSVHTAPQKPPSLR